MNFDLCENLLEILILYWFYKRRKIVRRWNVSPINRSRLILGEFHHLVRDYRGSTADAPMKHFSYFRMGKNRFDDLVRRVQPFIKHSQTHEIPITAEERVAITLRMLAHGMSQTSVAQSYRMGKSTVNGILYETCDAIWKALQPDFLASPDTNQWVEVSEEFWRIWNFPNLTNGSSLTKLYLETSEINYL